jgi:hypothetical protein
MKLAGDHPTRYGANKVIFTIQLDIGAPRVAACAHTGWPTLGSTLDLWLENTQGGGWKGVGWAIQTAP